jgi:ribosomal protein L29
MELTELRQKNNQELQELLSKKKKEYQDVVADVFQSKEKNVKKPSTIRKVMARINTVIREKEILAVEAIEEVKKDA